MTQFLLVLKVIIANWKKTKGQLLFTILGITIASALWSSIDIVNNQTIKAQKHLSELQGVNNTYFCGSYFGYGFHEDGLNSGIEISNKL